MVKKIAIQGFLVCFLLIFPFQGFPGNHSIEAMQQKWPVRILLTSKKTQLTFQNKSGFIVHLQNDYLFDHKEITIFPLIEAKTFMNGFYLILLKKGFSLEEAIVFSEQAMEKHFKESTVRFLISEQTKSQFSVSIGLFDSKKEADFIGSALQSLYPSCSITRHEPSENACRLDLDARISLLSAFTNSPKAFLGLSLSYEKTPTQYNQVFYPDQLQLFVENNTLSLVNQTDIETYLQGVVGSEMPDDWPLEALRAQALASRTYAYSRCLSARVRNAYFDVTNDTRSQVYLGVRNTPHSSDAIASTEGLILTSQSKPIESVFHSSSGGYTENNECIWSGSPAVYLRGVPSPGEEISPHFSWYQSIPKSEVIKKLNTILIKKQSRTIPADHPFELSIREKGVSPRVRKVSLKINEQEIVLSGSEFVSLFSLKSTWFDLNWITPSPSTQTSPLVGYYFKRRLNQDAQEPILYVTGRGWGHGVGMPQYGALAMALKGYSYPYILKHYYSSVQIEMMPPYSSASEKPCSLQNQLNFDPSSVSIQINSNQDIILKIKTSSSVFGVSFELEYPKELIQINQEDIREGTFLKSDQRSTLFLVSPSEKGYTIGLSREGKVGGVSGEGDLLLFRFKGLQKGSSSIQLHHFQALDSRLEPIVFQISSLPFEIVEKDIEPPVSKFIQTPALLINQKKVFFEWAGIDNQTLPNELLFSYRLNQDPWSAFSFVKNVSFTLMSDGLYTFSIQAKDKEGNLELSPLEYRFTLDTTPPVLKLISPPEQTNQASVIIKGFTEKEATLLMNGQTLDLTEDGTFSIQVGLEMGSNSFQFIAMDKATNTTVQEITILRKEFQPILITMTIGSKKAIVDDNVMTLDSAPFIKQSRTFVPLRFIAEAFGAEVLWFPETRKIEIQLSHPLVKKYIVLWIDQVTASVNEAMYPLDVAPFIVPPGRTVVPIRFIAEAMESKVEWYSLTQTIQITFPGMINNENSENSFFRR